MPRLDRQAPSDRRLKPEASRTSSSSVARTIAQPLGPEQGDAGFTLVEVLVSLALFALIATAGFATLGGILQVRARTESEVERLADLQRTMYLLTQDFGQIAPGPLRIGPGDIGFRRFGVGPVGETSVRYALTGGSLTRALGEGATARSQPLLAGVTDARLSFYTPALGWSPNWPPPSAPAEARPAAVAVEFTLDPAAGRPSGSVRRVIELPGSP